MRKLVKYLFMTFFILNVSFLLSKECRESEIFIFQLNIIENYINSSTCDSINNINKAIFFMEGVTDKYTDEDISWGYKHEVDRKDFEMWNNWYVNNQDSLCTKEYKEKINEVLKDINPDVNEFIKQKK
jgi:hypothetical protein